MFTDSAWLIHLIRNEALPTARDSRKAAHTLSYLGYSHTQIQLAQLVFEQQPGMDEATGCSRPRGHDFLAPITGNLEKSKRLSVP